MIVPKGCGSADDVVLTSKDELARPCLSLYSLSRPHTSPSSPSPP